MAHIARNLFRRLQPAKRVNPMKLRGLQDRCRSLESEIAKAEADIAGYESALAEFVSAEETLRVIAASGPAPRRTRRAHDQLGTTLERARNGRRLNVNYAAAGYRFRP